MGFLSMLIASAIVAKSGFSLLSLVAAICGVVIALTQSPSTKTPSLKPDCVEASVNDAQIDPKASQESVQQTVATTESSFRLYRQNDLNRIVASLLAKGSILVAGEEGSGKSVLAHAVISQLQNDGFTVAFVEPASTKQMLLEIAEQLGVEIHSLEGKALSADHLKVKIADFLKENTAFLIVDDCHNCDSRFRTWLKLLKRVGIPMAIFAKNPPKTDIFSNLPPLVLYPLPEYAIREIMEQAALSRGLNLKNSDLARLQERAGGNPMLASRAIDEEYLGLEVEAADHGRYVDTTPLILIVGVFLMVLRFLGMGTNNHALYIFSGIGAVIFLGFSRLLYNLPQENKRITR